MLLFPWIINVVIYYIKCFNLLNETQLIVSFLKTELNNIIINVFTNRILTQLNITDYLK